jgi:pyruvate dehydrogenase E1 component beta subunit
VLDTPLAESGIVGTAIGLAMAGFRPVVEIQFDGFVFPAFDQITTQLAKLTNRHEGRCRCRSSSASRTAATSARSSTTRRARRRTSRTRGPARRVPSTPNDAYWMIQDAIASPDPVIFLEPKAKYWMKGEVETPSARSRCTRRGSCGAAPTSPSSVTARW